ncbi:hypothetical protein D5S17_10135 [Pseudonocardiaceae bacterium YIM PH 21723]|nr:hypothetical protein D5S17_10135 [Pseudonocardiaceae bacterium YIM PH 21723]
MTELWQRCAAVADTLSLPAAFDKDAFIAELRRVRGRDVVLIPVTTDSDSPCGLVASTARADYICYADNTTELHQLHILLHEAGHLLLEHAGSTPIDTGLLRMLMPGLSEQLVRRVLGRTVYSATEEREAELFATLVLQRAGSAPAQPDKDVPGLDRLDAVFGPSKAQ